MEIKDLLHLIARKFFLILAVAILFAASAALYTYYTFVPQYTVSATLIVTKPANADAASDTEKYTYSDLLFTQKLVKTYSVIITSKTVLGKVIENLGLPMSVNSLQSHVYVRGIEETEIMEIFVTDTDAKRAMDIANEIARVCPEEIIRIVNAASVNVIDEAVLPHSMSVPNTLQSGLLGAAVGFAAMTGLFVMLEYFRQTVKTPDDVTTLFSLPVIGKLPLEVKRGKKRKSAPAGAYGLIDEDDFHAMEAIKALRTNVEYLMTRKNGKVIMVTSSLPSEGKTTMIANLGLHLTLTGNRVLIIDCDLRKPKLHRYFHLSSHSGLTSVIEGKYGLDIAVAHVRDRLDVLCSGPLPDNPVEVLDSDEMAALVREARKEYNYILLDLPSASQMTDATVLAPLADGILLVIKHLHTPTEIVKTAIDNLTQVGARIDGVVLTQISTRQMNQYYHYVYHQYYREDDIIKHAKP